MRIKRKNKGSKMEISMGFSCNREHQDGWHKSVTGWGEDGLLRDKCDEGRN